MPRRKTDLVRAPTGPVELARELEQLQGRAERQVELSAAHNTRVAYTIDYGQFEVWCSQRGAKSLPAPEQVLSLYLAHLEQIGLVPSTIERKLAAIVRVHRTNDHPSPRTARISEQLKGIKRGSPERRPRPIKEAPPLTTAELRQLVDTMGEHPSVLVARDKAVLLVGWACAMRRSEIIGLELLDAEHTREGWKIWIRRSKTDQEGKGIALALAPAEINPALCPVAALEAWIEARGTKPGALFWKSQERGGGASRRSPVLLAGEPMPWTQVNHLVKRWCKRAKLARQKGPFTPHSLRAGFITEAIATGKPISGTKDRSRHVSMDVFFKYVRSAMTFENNVQKGML